MGRFLQLVWMAALLVTGWADAWSVGSPRSSATIHRRHSQTTRSAKTPRILLQMAAGQDKQRDASRSGTKRERLDKLAELVIDPPWLESGNIVIKCSCLDLNAWCTTYYYAVSMT